MQALHHSAGRRSALEPDGAAHPGAPDIDESHAVAGVRQLLNGGHATLTPALLTSGTGWGLVNFGFLPSNLV